MSKTVLVIGASSGIGLATVNYFADRGYRCLAASRHPVKSTNPRIIPVKLDITKPVDITRLTTYLARHRIRVNVLVNAAGVGYQGPVELFTPDQLRAQFEVNCFGAIRVIQAIIPQMRRQGSGHIINVSSVRGQLTSAFIGLYSASKYALESLSEALFYELAPFGIHVSLVEPGVFRTDFNQSVVTPANSSLYQPAWGGFRRRLDFSRQLMTTSWLGPLSDPTRVAKLIYQITQSADPKLRYPIGLDCRLALLAHALLPPRLWQLLAR